jgi:hypothetical protein
MKRSYLFFLTALLVYQTASANEPQSAPIVKHFIQVNLLEPFGKTGVEFELDVSGHIKKLAVSYNGKRLIASSELLEDIGTPRFDTLTVSYEDVFELGTLNSFSVCFSSLNDKTGERGKGDNYPTFTVHNHEISRMDYLTSDLLQVRRCYPKGM